MLGNVEAGGTGHNVIIARAHSSFSRVSAVAIAMITAEGKRDIPRPKHDGALQQVKLLGTEP